MNVYVTSRLHVETATPQTSENRRVEIADPIVFEEIFPLGIRS